MIELVLAVAANTMLSPLDLAVTPVAGSDPTVSASAGMKDQKLNLSMSSTTSCIAGKFVIDDCNTWD